MSVCMQSIYCFSIFIETGDVANGSFVFIQDFMSVSKL